MYISFDKILFLPFSNFNGLNVTGLLILTKVKKNAVNVLKDGVFGSFFEITPDAPNFFHFVS